MSPVPIVVGDESSPTERELARIAGRSDPSDDLDILIGACANCDRREHCVPGDTGEQAFRTVPVAHRQLASGEALYRAGDRLTTVFALRSGFMKSCSMTNTGKHDVVDFLMPGDLIGLDGLGARHHTLDAVAVEQTQVCALAPTQLLNAAATNRGVGDRLLTLYGDALRRRHDVLRIRRFARSEARVAAFLLDQSVRFEALGYAAADFRLRPGRADIASYLAITVDTVSRALRQLGEHGAIRLDGRRVRVLDARKLARLADVDATPT